MPNTHSALAPSLAKPATPVLTVCRIHFRSAALPHKTGFAGTPGAWFSSQIALSAECVANTTAVFSLSGNNLFSYAKNVVYLCGLRVYKLGEIGSKTIGVVHTTRRHLGSTVYKPIEFALVFAQACRFLYTVCGQLFSQISSVNELIVHIIHIAYKEHDYLKKRIYLI